MTTPIVPIGRSARIRTLTAALLVGAARLHAQGPPVTEELRIDGMASATTAIELGASVVVPSGVYVRTAFTAATGATRRDGATVSATRLEAVSRFLLDPFRESPYGLSIGAGLGATNAAGGPHWRPYLALVFDLELARAGGVTPAIQLGLGGGARLGVVLRPGTGRWR